MSQPDQRDIEGGGNPGPDRSPDQPHSPSNQPFQSLRGASDYFDSSWPIYLMYSKIAEEKDNNMAERCQKYTDGILIFSGLFSATVGALLAVSISDLRPNSQDTSAFYLRNIYQVLGNSNGSQPSIPSTLADPPVFSPPSYAIWVNSLWFLSLAVSISSAMEATMIRKWAVDYIDVTQLPWETLAKRVRTRAIFSQGNPGPDILWGTNIAHAYLHLSLLLFIVGALIYLFNISHSTFYAVGSWVVFMACHYSAATVSAFFTTHDLFHTPLSSLALRIYLGIFYVVFRFFSYLPPLHGFRDNTRRRYHDLNNRYSNGLLVGKCRAAQEIASKPSSEIDDRILERILPTLDEDHALETFFDAIPGFCNSKLCVLPLSFRMQRELQRALDAFMNLTFSSDSVSKSARASRLITCLNAAHATLGPHEVSRVLDNILNGHWDEALQSVEIGHALRLWDHSQEHDLKIRRIVASIITRAPVRDDRWVMLVKESFGVPDRVIWDSLPHGDCVLLSILIHVSREASHAGSFPWEILSSLSQFDIHNTVPGLQHDFCTLWNEIVQEARNRGRSSTLVKILDEIHHVYIALHPDTHATPTSFSTSTDSLDQGTNASHAPVFDFIPDQPLSYPLCNIASHRPYTTAHDPVAISETVSLPTQSGDSPESDASESPHPPTLDNGTSSLRLAEETGTITGLPSPFDPSTASEIVETSQAPRATFPVHSSLPSSDGSPQDDVTTAQRGTTSAAKLSHPLESNKQQGLTSPYVAPLADTSGTLSTVPTPTPLPVSTPSAPNNLFATYDRSPAFISRYSLLASYDGFSVPGSLSSPPIPAPPLPSAELPPPRGSMLPKDPSDDATPPRLHLRWLGDTSNGNMRLANAVLQLLVYCPTFRDLFKDLGRLVGQHRREETGGSATPVIDATVKFLDGFAYDGKSIVAHQFLQQSGGSKVGEDEDRERDDAVVHYLYDAMEKRRFVNVRDGLQQDAAVFLSLYLEALDEELVTLRPSIGTRRLASTLRVDEHEEETQSGASHTGVRERDYTVRSVESPISRIFGGRSRSTVRAPNQPDNVSVEDWRSLKLNIQPDSVHTIQDALIHVSQPQHMPAGQPGSSETNQQVLLEALPPILVLHLERFLYHANTDGVVKMSKPIQFMSELEIPPVIMAPASGKSAEPVYYKLHGVLYHHGESESGGRYTVSVLHPNGDGGSEEAWLHIDDEAARVVRHEDVFGGHGNERGDGQCVYMLLYCRAASTRT